MKKNPESSRTREMLDEYDFGPGIRGKYAEHTNVVVLDPDVAKAFPTASDVNRALRNLLTKAEVQCS